MGYYRLDLERAVNELRAELAKLSNRQDPESAADGLVAERRKL